jgi:hypothetical protein
VVEVIVEHRGEQVVRARDGMDVAGEVEIHVVGGDDLRLAATRAAALHAEVRPERGLSQRDRARLADLRQPCASPIEQVVLPSPAGVGVIAERARAGRAGCGPRVRATRASPCRGRTAPRNRGRGRASGRSPGSVSSWASVVRAEPPVPSPSRPARRPRGSYPNGRFRQWSGRAPADGPDVDPASDGVYNPPRRGARPRATRGGPRPCETVDTAEGAPQLMVDSGRS